MGSSLDRRQFLAALSGMVAVSTLPLPALASGGLDIDSPSDNIALRVFLPNTAEHRYRGALHPMELADGRTGTLNVLTIEEYLYGVVPLEMPSSWPYAALEAQAIVARTFAVRRRNPNHPYDLIAGTVDQEYGGIEAEATLSTAAVDASMGMIVQYQDQPANVCYMSCCGGYTENAARLWGNDYPYLEGVACTTCTQSPYYRWSIQLQWSAFARAVGIPIDALPQAIVMDQLGVGGRPAGLRLITSGRDEIAVSTTQLRRGLGSRLKSTFIRSVQIGDASSADAETSATPLPSLAPDALDDDLQASERTNGLQRDPLLTINGAGYGHGVGLCQWGARGMAAAGATGQDIIAHYFPTTTLGGNIGVATSMRDARLR